MLKNVKFFRYFRSRRDRGDIRESYATEPDRRFDHTVGRPGTSGEAQPACETAKIFDAASERAFEQLKEAGIPE